MNVHFIIILGIVTTASPTIIYNDAKQYNLFALYILIHCCQLVIGDTLIRSITTLPIDCPKRYTSGKEFFLG